MRLVDMLCASILIGAAIGLILPGQPRTAGTPDASTVSSPCKSLVCERITWLRTPLMHRATH